MNVASSVYGRWTWMAMVSFFSVCLLNITHSSCSYHQDAIFRTDHASRWTCAAYICIIAVGGCEPVLVVNLCWVWTCAGVNLYLHHSCWWLWTCAGCEPVLVWTCICLEHVCSYQCGALLSVINVNAVLHYLFLNVKSHASGENAVLHFLLGVNMWMLTELLVRQF